MKRPLIRLNPVTQKRLRRFRGIKRGWWAMWILIITFVISLFAELICNKNPLLIRYEGRFYFPIFKYYPEDTFTGSGKQTRPDYKDINETAAFQDNSDNYMIFPLVPYSPEETIDPARIEIPNEVMVRIMAVEHTATVNVDPEYEIERNYGADYFFGLEKEEDARGMDFQEHWSVSDALKEAIRLRFENQNAPRYEETIRRKSEGIPRQAVVSMPDFEPRRREPRSVRLTLREVLEADAKPGLLVFNEDLEIKRGGAPMWDSASEEEKAQVLELVQERFEQPVVFQSLALGGDMYNLAFEKEDLRFPFRPILWSHPLGLDDAGRDVLVRIFYGYRLSMSFGLLLVLAATILGVIIGSVQGYFAGLLDITGQRLIEIWQALPFLYVMILLGSTFGRSFSLLLVVYGLFNWIGLSYYMRAEFLRLRKQQFVEAARAIGVPTWKILFKHIFPNALVPIITFLPFSLVGAIGALSALDYLGFGVPPPTPSWGDLLNQAQTYRWAWWLILWPSLSLFIVMLLGVFVGEGLRNAFDPRDYTDIK
ncbi:MAG: ABC transporter permease subunit [Candidatus Sumerlaeia bacterium]